MPKRERYSFEYLILKILGYFFRNKSNGPFSKYHLMTKIKGLPAQRQDRISDVLELLIKKGWIVTFPIPSENRILYNISKEGEEWYRRRGIFFEKDLLQYIYDHR